MDSGIETVARIGYAAKGVVYAIVGWLAIQSAFSAGSETTGSKGALATLLEQPYGQVLLVLVALGLAAYAFWRFVQAFADPEGEGSDTKGLVKRAASFASGVVHTSLVIWAAQAVSFGGTSSGSETSDGAKSMTAELMSHAYGEWLVAFAGLAIAAAGILQMVKGYKEKFRRELALSELSATGRKWAVWAGKIGLMARGFVFVVIGSFLCIAAYRSDPQQAKGLGEALIALEQAPYGPYLLSIVGIGLVAYGAYQFVEAKLRVFPAT
jgi:hypothetical protein